MEYFWQYLKQHKKVIAVFLLFVLIFGLTFALYQLPLSAVLYSAGLCACLGIGIMLFDFKNFVEKHRALKHLMQEILVNCEHLPVPAGLLETDYQELVRLLFEAKKDLNDKMNHRYTGLVEYYTIWAPPDTIKSCSQETTRQRYSNSESAKQDNHPFPARKKRQTNAECLKNTATYPKMQDKKTMRQSMQARRLDRWQGSVFYNTHRVHPPSEKS